MKRIAFAWVAIVIVLSFSSAPANADYLPNQKFFGKMEVMLEGATTLRSVLELQRQVDTGTRYIDGGEAATFVFSSIDRTFWQLEEWRLQTEGYFLVTITKMWPTMAVQWQMKFALDGKGIYDADLMREKDVKIASPEAIEKSERAQRLLLERGRPVIVGGEEV